MKKLLAVFVILASVMMFASSAFASEMTFENEVNEVIGTIDMAALFAQYEKHMEGVCADGTEYAFTPSSMGIFMEMHIMRANEFFGFVIEIGEDSAFSLINKNITAFGF